MTTSDISKAIITTVNRIPTGVKIDIMRFSVQLLLDYKVIDLNTVLRLLAQNFRKLFAQIEDFSLKSATSQALLSTISELKGCV